LQFPAFPSKRKNVQLRENLELYKVFFEFHKKQKGTAGPTIPKMEKSGSYEEQRQLAPTSGHPSV
jgi:hypothetical protein